MSDRLQLEFDDWIIFPEDGGLEHKHKVQIVPKDDSYLATIAVFYNDKGRIGMCCTLCKVPVPEDIIAIHDFIAGPHRGYRYALNLR